MKHFTFVLLAAAFLASAATETRDGRWWLKLSQLEKAIYTAGMMDGVNVGEGISPEPELFTARAAELLANKNSKQ